MPVIDTFGYVKKGAGLLTKDSHNILGFLNPNGFLPSAVIAIVNENGSDFGIFPDLSVVKISDFERKKSSTPNFIPSEDNHVIRQGEYAFCLFKNSFVIGTPLLIYLKLVDAFKSPNFSKDEDYRDIMLSYLEAENLNTIFSESPLNTETCLLLGKNIPILKILLHPRIKKNKEEASRLIVQYVTKTRTKTFYKKNIGKTQKLEALILKPKTLKALKGAMLKTLSFNADTARILDVAIGTIQTELSRHLGLQQQNLLP